MTFPDDEVVISDPPPTATAGGVPADTRVIGLAEGWGSDPPEPTPSGNSSTSSTRRSSCPRCRHTDGEGCGCPFDTRLAARLVEMSRLQDGWLDGHGKAPSDDALKAARDIALALRIHDTVLIAPTEEGGLNLEWSDRNGGHELEIGPDLSALLLTIEPQPPEPPMPEPTPAEHCGHLSPQTLLTTPPVECVLRPGHSGSHASETNMRWYPTPAPVPPPAGVRDQIVRAVSRVLLDSAGRLVPNHIAETAQAVSDTADAVLRVPAIAEALGAAAAVERVRAVHQPVEYRGRVICVDCSAYWGDTCDNGPQPHPCPTIAALDPQEQP